MITEVTLQLRARARAMAATTATFDTFGAGAAAVRAIVQLELWPSNCRLVSSLEALAMGLGDGGAAVLLLAFEAPGAMDGAAALLRSKAEAAARVCRSLGGTVGAVKVSLPGDAGSATHDGGRARTRVCVWGGGCACAHERTLLLLPGEMGEWRSSFISAPYLREALLVRGVVVETFETAVTWPALGRLVEGVTAAVGAAVERVSGRPGLVTVRLTHAYPSGAAPYFTVVMQGAETPAAVSQQWAAVKAAASLAIEAAGGTCSHHHAVGTDHVRFFEREVGGLVRALAGAKSALDARWCLNPGILLRPPPQLMQSKL